MKEKAKERALVVLQKIGENSQKRETDKISEDQIQVEIVAARRERRLKHVPVESSR